MNKMVNTKHNRKKIHFLDRPILELNRDELLNCIEVCMDEIQYFKDLHIKSEKEKFEILFNHE